MEGAGSGRPLRGVRAAATEPPDSRSRMGAGKGRVSTTELASIVGAHATNVGSVLEGLEAEGALRGARPGRREAGFFYVPT